MKNLIELYEFLDNTNTETLLLSIVELIQNLNEQFEGESDLRILSYRNNIKNLYKLIDYQFEKGITGIVGEKTQGNTKGKPHEKSIFETLANSIGLTIKIETPTKEN